MVCTIQDAVSQSFDYAIIGGGTAALTVAARLTEDPNVSVLVLESGASHVDDPAVAKLTSLGSHFGNEQYMYRLQTVKQPYANNREIDWHAGKGLGGSSCINFMRWTKPPSEDIDDWGRLGNPGWDWNNYQKSVEKTEGFVDPPIALQKKLGLDVQSSTWTIGRNGPLKLNYPTRTPASEIDTQKTFLSAGIPVAPRPFNGDPRGFFFAPNSYVPSVSERCSSLGVFYLPNKDRSNYTVLTHAHVSRVLTTKMPDGNLTATGVEFVRDGQRYSVNARKEIIVSAGAMNSPQILELSGIGAKRILEKIDVPVKLELPGVGENLQEHLMLGVSWELKDNATAGSVIFSGYSIGAEENAPSATDSGMMGSTGFVFTSLDKIAPHAAQAIYEKALKLAARTDLPAGLAEQYRILAARLDPAQTSGVGAGFEYVMLPGVFGSSGGGEDGKRYVSVIVALNHPFSRGTVHAVSNDPQTPPAFDPRYLEQEIDLDMYVEAVKFARGVASQGALKDIIAKELSPGAAVDDDAKLRNWIKDVFSGEWHTTSTCSMLPKDKGGVVDPTLKVYGTTNLRVVDLSIVPLHFAAHPQATAYAIAEQAAEIIKGNL